MERDHSKKRDTARAIVIKDGALLLIERHRGKLHYFSIPGGGIEPGETPEQTVVREAAEETSTIIVPKRLLYTWQDGPHMHRFYLCEYVSGKPQLHPDSEEANARSGNTFYPCWVGLTDVKNISFGHWTPVGKQLLRDLTAGFSDEPVTVK